MSIYWRTVGGHTLPIPVSGHPALELCNTRTGWDVAEPKEYLSSYAHAVTLAADLGLLGADDAGRCLTLAAEDPAGAERALGRVYRLREDLYRVTTEPSSTAATRRLDGAMLTARRRYRFSGPAAGGSPVWAPTVDLDAPRDAFARAIEDLLRALRGRPSRRARGRVAGGCSPI